MESKYALENYLQRMSEILKGQLPEHGCPEIKSTGEDVDKVAAGEA